MIDKYHVTALNFLFFVGIWRGILYDVERDETHYVEMETSDWEEKTVRELKQPLTFEFTCKESVINKIKY